MNKRSRSLQASIPSNKFYPPRINPDHSLQRQHLITRQLETPSATKKYIIIEAQAGQGKTTLSYQYLLHSNHPFIWYQIGQEDTDPITLVSALYYGLSKCLPTFSSPPFESILHEGQIGPLDTKSCINQLFHDLDTILTEDIYLTFDDLHLLADSPFSLELIDHLIDSAPPLLNFIFTSRHKLRFQAQELKRTPLPLYLNTDDLALNVQDIEALYQIVFNKDLTKKEAEHIRQRTNGWVMGIILSAHPFAAKSSEDRTVDDRSASGMFREKTDQYDLSYFEEEIFSHIDPVLHDALLHLCFLDEIEIMPARHITDLEDIARHLSKMADENFFIYHLDDDKSVFRFHHLFQEFLQTKCSELYGDDYIADLYRRIADFYLGLDLVEKALKPLCQGRDYHRMETILKQMGLRLLAQNQTATILGILQTIPDEVLNEHTWLAFFYGLLTTDTNPRHTLPYFETCRTQFAQNSDEPGELMSLSQLIYFHFVISGRYQLGSTLLQRTHTLFERNYRQLPEDITIIVARNLAAGYCFFNGQMEQAHHYASLGYELAKHLDSKNFIAATRFILGYIALLSGDRRAVRHEIEQSLHLASDPLVGMSNRLTLHIMQLCELSMHGCSPGFNHQKEQTRANVDKNVVRQTVAAPYLFIWSAIERIANGLPEDALEILDQGMNVSKSATSDHMTSQFLQWRSFAHALLANREQALKDIETSRCLRMESGGPFYTAYNYAITSASLFKLGLLTEALSGLQEGLNLARNISSPYIESCCYCYLALIAVQQQHEEQIIEYSTAWLRIMQENDYSYHWGWEPAMTQTLLNLAVKHGIAPEFAKSCAENRNGLSVLPTGESVPHLHIKMTGDFSVRLNGHTHFNLQDLSVQQRELIGFLIASAGFKASHDQIQLALWPDSPPDKARTNLDTLKHRLNKALQNKLPAETFPYLQVGKGFIQLCHVRVDAIDFIEAAQRGIKLSKQQLYWQAGNAFVEAFSYWEDDFTLSELFTSDQALNLYDDILESMRALSLRWSSTLLQHNRNNEALVILEKSAKLLKLDDECVARRYHLYIWKKNPLKAKDVLNSYEQELVNLGYGEQEVNEMRQELINRDDIIQ